MAKIGSKPQARARTARKPRTKPRLVEAASRSLMLTRDAVANIRDLVESGNQLAMLEVKRCEKELDEIEREIDQQILSAMGRSSKSRARSLLVSLHVVSDLERVGDLMLIAAHRFHEFHPRPPAKVRELLLKIAQSLQTMLEQLQHGFAESDPRYVAGVLRSDEQIDQMQRDVLTRLLRSGQEQELKNALNLLIMVQVFERAGDHLKNVAEALFFLVEARSLLHLSSREREEQLANLS